MIESDPERVEEELAEAINTLPQHLQETAASLPFPVLHHACMTGQLDLVRALLDAGVPPDLYPETEDEDDLPPLAWLARDRKDAAANALQVASFLIEQCEDLDEGGPLAAALEAEDVSMVRMLLAAGADGEVARLDVGPEEAKLLDALLEPYWATPVGANPHYIVAFDSHRTIWGIGLSEADASARAPIAVDEKTYEFGVADEGLVAAFLRGNSITWSEESGAAKSTAAR